MSLTLGRYELVEELGRGGMAEVFLARRRGPGGVEKRLAIKRIRRERASDPRLLSMFVDEARLSMAMVHKNIVPMFDFGRAGDELFLVMEYVDGADLGAALEGARQRSLPLAPEVAAFVAMEACQALDYAHTMSGEAVPGRAVVHRDVNPRNVLLSYAGEVKLVDFGVATAETDLGTAGRVRGTPAYMAPEQARAEAVDARTDIFSLGLVLFESLAGRRAYGPGSLEEILSAARNAEVPPLPESVPARLREIVIRATAREPNARYANARELQLDLDEYIVATRAAGAGGPPLGHRLAAWLRQVCPPDNASTTTMADPRPPEGPVVTFLDDGEAIVERAITTSEGTATQRSIAETVAEADEVVPGGAPAEPDRAAPRPRRLARPAVGLAIGGALIVLGVAFWLGPGRDAAPSGAAADSGPAALPLPSSPVSLDAARSARTDPINVPGQASANSEGRTAPRDAGAAVSAERGGDRAASGRGSRDAASVTSAGVRSDPATAAPGTVRVSSSPWAVVTVVGQEAKCDETPCQLTLPPGVHQLRLRNPLGGLEKTVEVRVSSGKTTDVVENLTR